ncbi:PHD finger protein ING1-like [Benincasa hispida]|uniref:PHD finger protein ING1-like n=1 Tax=Benincasa hispida TaxID=102211 RepID=UPI0019000426|nr:PHD finger protein ING1-like [Benincasa hispida]
MKLMMSKSIASELPIKRLPCRSGIFDLVDTYIQQLDQYLKNFDEKLRQERGSDAATGLPTSSVDGNTKSGRGTEGGRGGCKKNGQAAAATVATESSTATTPTGMELELPIDPNEPTYCLCNQVSYGEMVARDNPNVCDNFLPQFPIILVITTIS